MMGRCYLLIIVVSMLIFTSIPHGFVQANDANFDPNFHNQRANINRERAVERSKQPLQPRLNIYNDNQRGQVDYYSLSNQIERLGALIRYMGDVAARENHLSQEAGGIMPHVHTENFHQLYGPNGPTVRSVKALLEHRLVVAGNPRLKAGRIISNESTVTAEVMTAKEGALVEKFTIDKSTGVWKREY
jgi:hypothetical protein